MFYQWSLTIDFTNNLDSRHCCIKINLDIVLNRRKCLVSLTAFLPMTYSTPESFPDLFLPVLAGIVHWDRRETGRRKAPQTLGSTPVVCVQFTLGSINITVICVDHWKG